MNDVNRELNKQFQQIEDHLYSSGEEGYWSNLDKDENAELIAAVKTLGTRAAINKSQPHLFDVIFSPKREAGLELLRLKGDEICVDYGCMWGALSIPLAKRTKYVLGIDQTLNSLQFLKARAREENLANLDLLVANLREVKPLAGSFDLAVVNGVLEWIPEEGPVELKSYFGKFKPRAYGANPGEQQLVFLQKVRESLKENGRIYLAIENRYDYKMFLGIKDPHANIFFSSILPRKIANLLSLALLGRPYVNWLYSFWGINKLLKKAGFVKVQLFMCFPDYRFPERIIPYEGSLADFQPSALFGNPGGRQGKKPLWKRIAGGLFRKGQLILFKKARAKRLAPSIIAIGYK